MLLWTVFVNFVHHAERLSLDYNSQLPIAHPKY